MTLPCVVCDKPLEDAFPHSSVNHPNDGVVATTRGNYGSTVFDPVSTGHYLEFNICDECLRRKGQEGRVLLGQDHKPVVSPLLAYFPPALIGSLPVQRELVPWRENLENEGEDDWLVLEPEEIGSELYPEVEYQSGILERHGPNVEKETNEW